MKEQETGRGRRTIIALRRKALIVRVAKSLMAGSMWVLCKDKKKWLLKWPTILDTRGANKFFHLTKTTRKCKKSRYCDRRNFCTRFNFVHCVLLAESTTFSSIRTYTCMYTSVDSMWHDRRCPKIYGVRKLRSAGGRNFYVYENSCDYSTFECTKII